MLSKQKVKYIQSLGHKKQREAESCFVAEGPKLVNEMLQANPRAIIEILATEEWLSEPGIRSFDQLITIITGAELEKISQLTTPNKVLALVKQYDHGDIVDTKNQFILGLDTIRDPGNLGTIIRIADWFGVRQIIASYDSAELYNSKVVQSTMGSIARVKVFYKNLAEWLSEQTALPIYAAGLDGTNINSLEKIKEGVIIIGNESKGISPDVMQYATTKITIPRRGEAESLNAAVATGIILSHIT